MRQFAKPSPMDRLSLEARVLYTGFLGFLLIGLASSAWLYRDSFGGLSGAGASDYYRGGAGTLEPAAAPAPLPADGPALELPGEAVAAQPMRLEKPARQVLETFHFHLFTVPVILLVVGHLFMLTSLSSRLKVAVLLLATTATLAHLLAPLVVRFGAGELGALMPASALVASLGWLPMLALPIWEMWRPRPS